MTGLNDLPHELFREVFDLLVPLDTDVREWDDDATWTLRLRLVCRQFDHIVLDWFLKLIRLGLFNLDDLPLTSAPDLTPSKIQMGIRLLTHRMRATRNEGDTPLVRAIRQGAEDASTLLLPGGSEDGHSLRMEYERGLITVSVACMCVLGVLKDLSGIQGEDEGPGSIDDKHHTALIAAATLGRVSDMKKLIGMGADLSAENTFFGIPLLAASFGGHIPAVEYLLDQGVDPKKRLSDGLTALHYAVQGGQEHVVQLLLKVGVDPDPKNEFQESPLLCAACGGHTGIAKLLLEREEVDVNCRAQNGYSVLAYAAYNGHDNILKMLLAHPQIEVNGQDGDGLTALMMAAYRGRENAARLLLTRDDIDVNVVGGQSISALATAAIHKRKGILRLLLQRPDIKVNLEIESEEESEDPGTPALNFAADVGFQDGVEMLLEHPDINVDCVDAEGATPMTRAAASGHLGIVKLLLDRDDIDWNHMDEDGNTALILAATEGQVATVKLLMEHPNVETYPNNDGVTPLMGAASNGNEEVVRLFLTRNEYTDELTDEEVSDALEMANQYEQEGTMAILRQFQSGGVKDSS